MLQSFILIDEFKQTRSATSSSSSTTALNVTDNGKGILA